jgi:HK97 family phage prohead protease
MLHLTCAATLRGSVKASSDGRTIAGYASAFNNVDDGGDIMLPGAFSKTLADRGPESPQPRIRMLYQHDPKMLIGKPSMLREDDKGLYFECTLPETTLANDVLALYKANILGEHSIGYDPIEASYDRATNTRSLKEVKLWEYSPVTWGMNSQTPLVAVKSAGARDQIAARLASVETFLTGYQFQDERVRDSIEHERKALGSAVKSSAATILQVSDQLAAILTKATAAPETNKSACGSPDLPLAGRGDAWDAGKAEDEIHSWATKADGSLDIAKLKSVHFWCADSPSKLGDFKLAFAYIQDGKATAIPRGIFAVAGALDGSQGNAVELPEGDVSAVKAKVAAYYGRMAKAFDDESIVPPWESKASKPGSRKRGLKRTGKARDFNTVYMQEQPASAIIEDFDQITAALRMATIEMLLERSDTYPAQMQTLLQQFAQAVGAWLDEAVQSDTWEDIADDAAEMAEFEANIQISYGYGYGSDWMGQQTPGAAVKRTPALPARLKEGRQISGTNRSALTTIANGLSDAMGMMGEHHGALVTLLDQTAPAQSSPDGQGSTETQPVGGSKSAAQPGASRGPRASNTQPNDTAPDAYAAILADVVSVLDARKKKIQ